MNDVVRFFDEVRLELGKVVWPKREEWIGSTIIVLVMVTAFALYLAFLDMSFAGLVKEIFKYFSLTR